MKKLFATLAIVAISILSVTATEVSEVWTTISKSPGMIMAPVDGSIAEKQGFQTLNVALNTSPTDTDLTQFGELIASIPANQKLTATNAQGFNVSIYAVPADAAGTEYNVMYTIAGENNGVKQMIVLYGTMSRDNIARAMSNINLEEIIGA